MDRTRLDVLAISEQSRSWSVDLDQIVAGAEGIADAGRRIAERARANATRATSSAAVLAAARINAVTAAEESDAVAGASAEQEEVIRRAHRCGG